MTIEELQKEIGEKLDNCEEYFKEHRKTWLDKGIDLSEVQYEKASSQANLTNAHRNDSCIKLYKWFLEKLDEIHS